MSFGQKSTRMWAALVAVLASCFATATPAQANWGEWECGGTIYLVGTQHNFTVPTWKKKGIFKDREKQCLQDLQSNWFKSNFLKALNLSQAEKDALCAAKTVQVRADYGFDDRKKSWNTLQSFAISCTCKTTCPADRWLETWTAPNPLGPKCVKSVQSLPAGVNKWVHIGGGYFTGDKSDLRHYIDAKVEGCTIN